MFACACVVSTQNVSAIASEGGRRFDRAAVLRWIDQNDSGYFIRDEGSQFDCMMLESAAFHAVYVFQPGNEAGLFRRIERL